MDIKIVLRIYATNLVRKVVIICCFEEENLGLHILGTTGLIPFKFDMYVNKNIVHIRHSFGKN